MIIQNEKVTIVKTEIGDNAYVTGDGIVSNERYTMIYEYPNYEPKIYSYTGDQLCEAFLRVANFLECNNVSELRTELNTIMSLIAARNINYKLYKSVHKNYERHIVKFFEKHFKAFNKPISLLKDMIKASLYIKLMQRNDKEAGYTAVKISDVQLSEEEIQAYEDTWQNQAVTKRLNISSFDMYKELLKAGVLYVDIYPDLNEYQNS